MGHVVQSKNDVILASPRRLAFMMARSAVVRMMGAPPKTKGTPLDLMAPRLEGDPARIWFQRTPRRADKG
jgi:hypothetical protein